MDIMDSFEAQIQSNHFPEFKKKNCTQSVEVLITNGYRFHYFSEIFWPF